MPILIALATDFIGMIHAGMLKTLLSTVQTGVTITHAKAITTPTEAIMLTKDVLAMLCIGMILLATNRTWLSGALMDATTTLAKIITTTTAITTITKITVVVHTMLTGFVLAITSTGMIHVVTSRMYIKTAAIQV